jgi:hypothetical protein
MPSTGLAILFVGLFFAELAKGVELKTLLRCEALDSRYLSDDGTAAGGDNWDLPADPVSISLPQFFVNAAHRSQEPINPGALDPCRDGM